MSLEQTFIMIKPDGVQRGLVGEIIKRFEQKGYYLRAMKFINVSRELAETHYIDLSSKPFYGSLVEYIIR
jgi:nucleoside-diphosphate kinase